MGKIEIYNCNEIQTNSSNKISRAELAEVFSKKYKIHLTVEDIDKCATKEEETQNRSKLPDYPIEEIWGTYHTLTSLIGSRLQAFKALDKHEYPPKFNNIEEWNKAIQKMIDAFELMKFPNSLHSKQDQGTIKQGLNLFCKYFIYAFRNLCYCKFKYFLTVHMHIIVICHNVSFFAVNKHIFKKSSATC